MLFGEAIDALKRGDQVRRRGWNGKGMFLFLDTPSITVSVIPGTLLPVSPAICMKTAQDTITVGWLASQTDMLADDWQIVE